MENPGWTPAASPSLRRIFRPVAWKVPIQKGARSGPTVAAIRSFISLAARLVKVKARISPGRAFCSANSQATRVVNTRVLPLPAPATTSTGPSGAMTASRWASFSVFNWSSKSPPWVSGRACHGAAGCHAGPRGSMGRVNTRSGT